MLSRRCCRTAQEAAGRQPAQPDWVAVTVMQLCQTLGASAQGNAAPAPQQSRGITPQALTGLLRTPAGLLYEENTIFKTQLADGKHNMD